MQKTGRGKKLQYIIKDIVDRKRMPEKLMRAIGPESTVIW